MSESREEIVDRTLDILSEYLTIPKATCRAMVMRFFDSPYIREEQTSVTHNIFENVDQENNDG